ncbi:hypothetical protein CIG75_18975 [Tumebacillus algifaecis]|uniref:YqzN/YkzM domain-containing protein n=1 Tax=Tumebacillus algifaecis TaxID=1214604 RepID=A0A223D5E8_9BACL|nr:hypothetical protein [Tumebacillus algifaecis]ASS76818.1 hypothetical protein CIG75_18975 [Tumebacillus algifaecis]
MVDIEKEDKPKVAEKPRYTKEQFLSSKQFTAAQKDVLVAVLRDGETYTTEQAKRMVEVFLRTEVR